MANMNSSRDVIVYCRHPLGIVLELYDPKEIDQRAKLSDTSVHGSVRFNPNPLKSLKKVVLNGSKTHPGFHYTLNNARGKAGKTRVPADFWEAWLSVNKNSSLVRDNIIFAEANEDKGEAKARELANEPTPFDAMPEDKLSTKVAYENEQAAINK